MLLARAGLSVLAVDRGRLGDDTLSTHALMRGAVLQLHRWGLLRALEAAGTPPIRSATFHYGEEDIPIPSSRATDRRPVRAAAHRSRPAARARRSGRGSEVVHGVAAIDLVRDARGRVAGAVLAGADGSPTRVEADIVIGADGIRSPIARL